MKSAAQDPWNEWRVVAERDCPYPFDVVEMRSCWRRGLTPAAAIESGIALRQHLADRAARRISAKGKGR
jgi:hypothetical protein